MGSRLSYGPPPNGGVCIAKGEYKMGLRKIGIVLALLAALSGGISASAQPKHSAAWYKTHGHHSAAWYKKHKRHSAAWYKTHKSHSAAWYKTHKK